MTIRPPALRIGDGIGLLSPSSEIASFPRRLSRGMAALDALGFRPMLAPHATGTYVVESAGIAGYFCRFHPNMRGKITAAAP